MLAVSLVIGSVLQGEPKHSSRPPTSADPETLAPASIPKAIAELPDYVDGFRVTGLAHWRGQLYVATNIGLLEFTDRHVAALHRWHAEDAVIESTWRDRANDALWFQDTHDHAFRSLDQAGWRFVPAPTPTKGHYTRGEVLSGFQVASDATGFWVAGAGEVSRWDSKAKLWQQEVCPGATAPVIALAPLRDTLLFIEHLDPMRLLREVPDSDESDVVHAVARNGEATTLRFRNGRAAPFYADQLAATEDSACIRTGEGSLLSASPHDLVELETPGPCEAVITTTSGKLLACFRGLGIYVREGNDWKKLFDYPYPPEEGKHLAHLAEQDGQVAYATASTRSIDRSASKGTSLKWVSAGTNALWVSRDGHLVPLFRDGVWTEGVLEK
jgi:hypothetical protein